MSDNWYIVDTSGETQGPMNELSLIELYMDENIHSKTYIWNGQSVKQWTPIMNVKYIYDKIKHHYVHHYQPVLSHPEHSSITTEQTTTEQITTEQECNNKIASPEIESSVDETNDNDQDTTEEYISADSDEHDADEQEQTHKQELDEIHQDQLQKEENQSTDQNNTVDIEQKYIEDKVDIKKDIEQEISNDSPNEDIGIKKSPNYPPTLQFLKRNSDRVDLMANIRNGITLRKEQVSSKQDGKRKVPKRIKDNFKSGNNGKDDRKPSVSYIRSEYLTNSQNENYTKKIYHQSRATQNKKDNNLHIDDDDDLSLSTSIDQDLLLEVKKQGYHNKNVNVPHHSVLPMYSNEVAERASMIRKKFGDVQVVSGKGRKNEKNGQINSNTSVELKYNALKSREIANRIAKLKHKLDQLTDKESWIITRIENVFLTAKR